MSHITLNGFTYIETLEDNVLSQLPGSLLLDGHSLTEPILFRLLLGTLNLKLNSQEDVITQKIGYTKLADVFTDNETNDPISEWVNKLFGLNDIDRYFNLNRKNKALFDELLSEFSYFFLNKSKSNHVSAFLHLYRALEFMSYSFPMIYSSKTSNFYTSFDTFKGFFTDKDHGQLRFFQEFVQVLFEKYTLRCRTKIDTYIGDEMLDKSKKKIIQKLCSKFPSYDDGYVISIEYKHLLDFMITLRNRYFHFESDRSDNISNINFDSELFFSALNDKFANWIAMIYFEILTHGVFKLNLLPTRG